MRTYGRVMEDVGANLRQAFSDEGVDEDVLTSLLEVSFVCSLRNT
jgi:hypothetical protein